MSRNTIEIYSSIECPFTYLALWRLRQVWPEYTDRAEIVWRSLSLEYINRRGTPKPLLAVESELMQRIDPGLPIRQWNRPDWEWPVTFWPAFEALACAQAQGPEAGFAMSWALRYAFFAEGRNPALRHELMQIAHEVASEGQLDTARFERDWDQGHFKETVIAESRRGWHELGVPGSPTFVFPDGTMAEAPAFGDVDIDEEQAVLRNYKPYQGDALQAFRALLDRGLSTR